MVSIRDLAQTVGFRGPSNRRTAEPSSIKSLTPIDNEVPGEATIRTSVDCYVSGQYVHKRGKTVEVTQRYTIWVTYSSSTQLQTMNQARDRIMMDFQQRYGGTFNISNVFVAQIPVPMNIKELPKPDAEPMEMYGGSAMFRSMTRAERARYEIGTQRTQSRLNIQSIKKRYNYR